MFDKDIATESYMMHYNCGKKICYTLIYALGKVVEYMQYRALTMSALK